jgi:hypothetical protein
MQHSSRKLPKKSALTPQQLKEAALAERRKREAVEGVGEGDLSRGRPPVSPADGHKAANSNRYWTEAKHTHKHGDNKYAPVPSSNAWRKSLTGNTDEAHGRQPAAAGQPAAPDAAQMPSRRAKGLKRYTPPYKQHMSEDAVDFFIYGIGGYVNMFKDYLEEAHKDIDTSDRALDVRAQKQHFTRVYLVFTRIFGSMLADCRKNTIMRWKEKSWDSGNCHTGPPGIGFWPLWMTPLPRIPRHKVTKGRLRHTSLPPECHRKPTTRKHSGSSARHSKTA